MRWRQQQQQEHHRRPGQLMNRLYHYWIDLQGRLYCIEVSITRPSIFLYLSNRSNNRTNIQEFQTKMPFGPTHIKDPKFLNFFFRQVKPNPDPVHQREWPYISPWWVSSLSPSHLCCSPQSPPLHLISSHLISSSHLIHSFILLILSIVHHSLSQFDLHDQVARRWTSSNPKTDP